MPTPELLAMSAQAVESVSIPNSWVVAGVGAVFFGLTGAITAVYRTLLKSKERELQREIKRTDRALANAIVADERAAETIGHLTTQYSRIADALEQDHA